MPEMLSQAKARLLVAIDAQLHCQECLRSRLCQNLLCRTNVRLCMLGLSSVELFKDSKHIF